MDKNHIMHGDEKELLIKELIKCPEIKKIYDKQSGYYREYVGDDWDYYMFNINQNLLEIYISWRLNNKDKDFHKGLIELIVK